MRNHIAVLSIAVFSIAALTTGLYLPGTPALSSPLQDEAKSPPTRGGGPAPGEPIDWQAQEQGILANQRQISFAELFVKAGESYFSPDNSQIIFQAVAQPEGNRKADEFYGMYLADIVRDDAGRISGMANVKRLSPEGSANTCGWFHPTEPGVVIFGSTLGPPSPGARPGYQRDTGRYRWMFPPEMRIFRCNLATADGTADSLELVLGDTTHYQAEGSISPDGRHLLYCSLESGSGDLYVLDLVTGRTTCIVSAKGYDGGPFFSPDGKRICYRSDRDLNDRLQLFVGELAFNEEGEIVGIQREHQLTDNTHVNWCPFWTNDGRHLIYATSELGHWNYEVFMVDADPGDLPGSNGTIKYGTRKRRITHGTRADVLPAFTSDGKTMIWTGQRGEDGESQMWVADFVIDPDARPAPPTRGQHPD